MSGRLKHTKVIELARSASQIVVKDKDGKSLITFGEDIIRIGSAVDNTGSIRLHNNVLQVWNNGTYVDITGGVGGGGSVDPEEVTTIVDEQIQTSITNVITPQINNITDTKVSAATISINNTTDTKISTAITNVITPQINNITDNRVSAATISINNTTDSKISTAITNTVNPQIDALKPTFITITGTSNYTLNTVTPITVIMRDAVMTASQNIILSSATPQAGYRLLIIRTSNATGTFDLTVGSTLVTLSVAGSAELVYNGTTWVVTYNSTAASTTPATVTETLKSTNFTLSSTDKGTRIVCTAAITVTVPAAGVLGNGFEVDIIADNGTVIVDGPGTTNFELITGDIISLFETNGKQRVVGGASTVVS